MSRRTDIVAIILDDAYLNLRQLSEQMAVWAVDTPANRASMYELWSEVATPGNDLTLFNGGNATSSECLPFPVATIEMHHPDATALLLIGLSKTSGLEEGLLQLGYSLEVRGDALLAVQQERQ